MIRVFISHSHADEPLATALTDLLLRALPLETSEIRCTSVAGLKLKGGAHGSTQLREEVMTADVVVGLVSMPSLDSLYVAFELGARWGTERPPIPLFAPGFDLTNLRGPLAEHNGLRSDVRTDVQQLIGEVADALEVEARRPDTYEGMLAAVLAAPSVPNGSAPTGAGRQPDVASPRPTETVRLVTPADIDAPMTATVLAGQDSVGASDDEVIARAHCRGKWPDDFKMFEYCLTRQLEAIGSLRKGGPEDMPADVFVRIRAGAVQKYPDDFVMRAQTEAGQIADYRTLRTGGPDDVPTDVFELIRAKAIEKWPHDFRMQLHTETDQIAAYRRTHS